MICFHCNAGSIALGIGSTAGSADTLTLPSGFMRRLDDTRVGGGGLGPGRDALLGVQADRKVGPARFMGSLHLQPRTRIGALNVAGAPGWPDFNRRQRREQR